jgi:hypothetical protein
MNGAPLVPITTCGNGLRISIPATAGEAASRIAFGCTQQAHVKFWRIENLLFDRGSHSPANTS